MPTAVPELELHRLVAEAVHRTEYANEGPTYDPARDQICRAAAAAAIAVVRERLVDELRARRDRAGGVSRVAFAEALDLVVDALGGAE